MITLDWLAKEIFFEMMIYKLIKKKNEPKVVYYIVRTKVFIDGGFHNKPTLLFGSSEP
jgi:hypothetical protein